MTIGSGNVFADLGLENPEELLVKAGFFHQISLAIEANGWTDAQAALAMQVEVSELRDLIRGRRFDLTVERLFQLLNRLGQDVQVLVTPKPSDQPGPAKVTVLGPGREQAAA